MSDQQFKVSSKPALTQAVQIQIFPQFVFLFHKLLGTDIIPKRDVEVEFSLRSSERITQRQVLLKITNT